MDIFLTVIVTWLALNFDLPVNYNHPSLKFLPEREIYKTLYGTDRSGYWPPVSVYSSSDDAIFLPQNWTAVAAADQSLLVHEMVHHLQKKAGFTYECAEAGELLAYAAQQKWLHQHGTNLKREFAIDDFKLIILTTCAFQ